MTKSGLHEKTNYLVCVQWKCYYGVPSIIQTCYWDLCLITDLINQHKVHQVHICTVILNAMNTTVIFIQDIFHSHESSNIHRCVTPGIAVIMTSVDVTIKNKIYQVIINKSQKRKTEKSNHGIKWGLIPLKKFSRIKMLLTLSIQFNIKQHNVNVDGIEGYQYMPGQVSSKTTSLNVVIKRNLLVNWSPD